MYYRYYRITFHMLECLVIPVIQSNIRGIDMLSINSTLQEIEEAHQEKNMKQLAKEIGIGEAKLKQLFATAGYEYDTAIKKWRYVRMDEVNESRSRSLWSIMEHGATDSDIGITDMEHGATDSNIGITDMEHGATDSNIGVTDMEHGTTDSNIDITDFTQDEMRVLKRIAQQQLLKSVPNGSVSILEAIQGVPNGSTSKKTFVVHEEIIEQLDAFCEQYRIKKSDFLAVAIHDALKKYW
ncbi:hypothetical protein V7166_16905 [Bacillus thuringiensis]